ncbi:hypothetical protein ABZ468_02475 [Streptomyces sp. NPDC005708]|uniref:hypothetical protein n=1 Tax=unclassified Streptomyces TaxID=2593676 RepID=UPI0033C5645C
MLPDGTTPLWRAVAGGSPAAFSATTTSSYVWRLVAYGLALPDDPRTTEAIERVGPRDDGFEHDHRADELWRWTWRKENPPGE